MAFEEFGNFVADDPSLPSHHYSNTKYVDNYLEEVPHGNLAREDVVTAEDKIADSVFVQSYIPRENPIATQSIKEKPWQKETYQQESLVNPAAQTNSANSESESKTDEEDNSNDSQGKVSDNETQTPTEIQSR
ncbi:hypothetical protein NE237_005635 [Protea cynaroides]|uniref:Uncharacterized protein n=1 Tax=Protea cynaroides TaxID=273540 RepID=A0A9Q0KL19_9MAGN|nr:hypothetical protein NE237_005635 [Protea cynaroides]